jgi:hypothetical protein
MDKCVQRLRRFMVPSPLAGEDAASLESRDGARTRDTGCKASDVLDMERSMLAKCANPSCSVPFRYLENGTLFRVETDPWCSSDGRFREYFWLCRTCSTTLTLRLDEFAGIRLESPGLPLRRGEEGIDFVLLDRQNGMLLSRVTLFNYRGRRREKSKGEPSRV